MPEKLIFLCNRHFPDLPNDQNIIRIDSYNAYQEASANWDGQEIAAAVVTAELNWKSNYYTDLFGLELIKDMRVKLQFRCPIVVTSYLPSGVFDYTSSTFQNGNLRFFKDPSISFVPLIDLEKNGLQIVYNLMEPPLEVDLHKELCQNLYLEVGYLNQCFNEFSRYLRKRSKDYVDLGMAQKFFYDIKRISVKLEKEVKALEKVYFDRIAESVDDEDDSVGGQLLLDALEDIKNLIKGKMPEDPVLGTFPEPNPSARFGDVLYVESDIELGKAMIRALASTYITCHLASNPDEAINIMKGDKANKITLVVTDLNFKDGSGKYYQKQGGGLLNELARLPNQVNVIALSDLDPYQNAMMAQKHKNVIVYFSKGEVFGSQNNLGRFVKLVAGLNEEIEKEILGMTRFNDLQKSLYKLHRQSIDYEQYENNIGHTAYKFVKWMKEGETVTEIERPKLNGRLNNANEARNLENFREVLLARRVVLGLCQVPEEMLKLAGGQRGIKNMSRDDRWLLIFFALKNGSLTNYNPDKEPSINAFNSTMSKCLKFSKMESYNWEGFRNMDITFEERLWLEKHWEELAS